MAKNPAFLFYSSDYYEGTRTMLPEERACYIDLLCYQHQKGGFIDTDLRRVMMYCSGIDEATLKATLEAKFKLCDKGWYNEKLKSVMDDRDKFSAKQSLNGVIGQFWKKSKRILSKDEYKNLGKLFENQSNEIVFNTLKSNNYSSDMDEAMLKAMLIAMLKHLEDENENENIIINNNNKGVSKIEIPSESEFITYAKENVPNYFNLSDAILMKYKAWIENEWKDGKNQPIKNWKSKLLNTIQYLTPTTKSKRYEPDPTPYASNDFIEQAIRKANAE